MSVISGVANVISGIAKKFDGTAIDYVSIFNWDDGKCIAQVVPDISGNWQYKYNGDLQVGLTYVADGCKPITHGSYYFEYVSNDKYANNVVSLLHFDGDLTDERGGVWLGTPTYTPAIYNQAAQMSNSNAISLEGVPLGEAFTIEFYIKVIEFSNNGYGHGILQIGGANDGTDGMYVVIWGANKSIMCGQSYRDYKFSTAPVDIGGTYHIAICRESGGDVFLYQNGIKNYMFKSTRDFTSKKITLGYANRQWNQNRSAIFDELRITKDVARYTENFTPPTEPFSI